MRRRHFFAAALAAAALPGAGRAQTPAAAPATPPAPQPIQPQNALEYAFVAALTNAEMRPVFRRQLLEGHVALALTSTQANAPPREIIIREGHSAGLVFTSVARLETVLGADTPRAILTGRAALERLRGKNVVINARLAPMLTLEPEDVARYLATPVSPTSAGPAQ